MKLGRRTRQVFPSCRCGLRELSSAAMAVRGRLNGVAICDFHENMRHLTARSYVG